MCIRDRNHRLRGLKDGRVTFAVKDYANQGKRGVMTLQASEFLRRFLQHVLPKGLMRIRHFGFMANRFRQNNLLLCRQLLATKPSQVRSQEIAMPESKQDVARQNDDRQAPICPKCKRGRLTVTTLLRADRAQSKLHRPSRAFFSLRPNPKVNDSS